MDILSDREPRLQIEGAEAFPIDSARVEWESDHSMLREIIGTDGRRLELPVGAKVTLYTGPSVVFMGKVQEDQTVLDLLSCEEDDGDYVDF